MSVVHIYALRDPCTGDIGYIGRAVDPERRLRQHIYQASRPDPPQTTPSLKDAWLRGLASAGKAPALTILETCDESEAHDAEYRHINDYGAIYPLVNATRAKDGRMAIDRAISSHSEQTRVTPFSGQRLRERRKGHSLTLQQLAALIDIDWRVVQRWETDKATPRPSNMKALCEALEVAYDDLMQ